MRPDPKHRRFRPFVPFGMLLIVFGLGGAVMLLWNYAVAPVIPVHPLTYWQAVCIFVLCRILFGRRPMMPRHPDHRKRMMHLRRHLENMSEEERREFRERFRRRFDRRGEEPNMNH